ncbi:flagellar associated protein [Monoraphidium neglectum]|uniref:glutathione transferase n=1 Tax=Monoraphidium neglectum TaxID=145388 RepID=A0A0D2KRN4_9CHLO|nr:flagellar associated protein [Monoraphidium neglectum]KIY98213.1 flagellar associated protein [Monoraphidium neglectum]|eukprot:XP_013897233.1 flagellar associated protein [Monoraphidium neglectum]
MVTIYYFPMQGRAEVIKLLCAYAGEKFEAVVHSYEEQKSNLDAFPFGQAPRLVDGDVDLVQSNACVRHLARKFRLYGASEAEMAKLVPQVAAGEGGGRGPDSPEQVDMIMDGVEDLRNKYTALIYAAEAKAAFWAKHCDKAAPLTQPNDGAHARYLARLLTKAGGEWFVGGGVTAADLAVYDVIHLLMRPALFPEEFRAAYPKLADHHDRVEALKGVKEYLAGPDRQAKINYNGLG